MKRSVRSVACVALAGGFSLLVGLHPAQAVQPWDLSTVPGLTSCEAEAQQVILETVYQRQTGGIYKDAWMKGVSGSVLGVALNLAVYDNGSLDYTLRNAALGDAATGVDDLIAKLEAITAKSPQMTPGARDKILNGRADNVAVSYNYSNPQSTYVSGSLGPHDGVNGDINGSNPVVGGGTNNLSQCVAGLSLIPAP